MTIQRIALVFDDRQRPDTTGTYCRTALATLVETVHVQPDDLDQLDEDDYDLFLTIDDGLELHWPQRLRPCAFWAIDTHLNFARSLKRSRAADWVFAAQKEGAARLLQEGVDTARWLPLACDPQRHARHEVAIAHDVAFVGNVFPGPRTELLQRLQQRFERTFVGRRFFEEMAAVFSASKIVFNRSVNNDLNMRVFEALCSGAMLITDALDGNGLDELFADGHHLVTYRDSHELLEKTSWYLSHHTERERIADAGRREVLAKHSYRQRMIELLEQIEQRPVSGNPPSTTLREVTQGKYAAVPATDNDSGGESPGRDLARANGQLANAAAKDRTYFEFPRPELLDRIPQTARRILDVGCGAGLLGAALKQRQDAEVWGIEREPEVAAAARERLDQVWHADAEHLFDDIPSDSVDCIVCGDVLEHLRDPLRFLKRCREWLRAGGQMVASLPNVRHLSVVSSLMAGNWTYEPAGLLDEDHVRFFTRSEIEKIFFRAGYRIVDMASVTDPKYAEWSRSGRQLEIGNGRWTYVADDDSDALDLLTYQYLVTAVGRRRPVRISRKDAITELETLRQEHPWPERRPAVDLTGVPSGWMADGARAALAATVPRDARVIVELGAWLGMSTRFMAGLARDATVIAIDHWEGSEEHRTHPEWGHRLGQLYDGFLDSCWMLRDRIIPLKGKTAWGLQAIADAGLSPDLIYVDADHRFDAVASDLKLCERLFPDAILVGDDYDDPGVRRAVDEIANCRTLQVEIYGREWRGWSMFPASGAIAAPDEYGLTSIVIVTHNQLALTRNCVNSIRHVTDESFELIFVDNASTDGTPGYLSSIAGATVITNNDNRGFPAAANQGLKAARGANILLLNNDTLATTGWLRRMLDALHSDESVGLVGPRSNKVSGAQYMDVDYDDLAQLDGFAWSIGTQYTGQTIVADRLVGFCLLMRRQVYESIGGLDERFGIGNFEDDDFCLRAQQAGYRAFIAADAFVHHFGGATFRATGVDYGQLLAENRRKFDDKWAGAQGANPLPTSRASLASTRKAEAQRDGAPGSDHQSRFALVAGADGALGIAPTGVRLSLCMIVRDNESTIGPALQSIKPWVDEMIVVDTGSKDRTPDLCRELGARVSEFPWCDDFSAARNVSIDRARGEWIFWMDSDDTISEECGRKLRALADGPHHQATLGYVMQVHCPAGGDSYDMTTVDHVKLFRNRPDLRFEQRIHEQILPSIRRAAGDVEFTDIYVIHSGSDQTPDGRRRKLERDYRLLSLDHEEHPDHPFVLFNLGMTYADDDRPADAVEHLTRCLSVSAPDESHVAKAHALLLSCLCRLGRHEEADVHCTRARERFSDDRELMFRQALLHQHFDRSAAAEEAYLELLEYSGTRKFESVDLDLNGYKARHNLALVYEARGADQQASEQWHSVSDERPDFRPAWRGRFEAELRLGRMNEATALIHELDGHEGLTPLAAVLRARLDEHQSNTGAAREELWAAQRRFPNDPDVLRELCRLQFEHFSPGDALASLEQLAEREPDGAVFHNLGTAYLESGQFEQAVASLRRSLELRPDSTETLRHLETALVRARTSAST